jgi:hypothetical protein
MIILQVNETMIEWHSLKLINEKRKSRGGAVGARFRLGRC